MSDTPAPPPLGGPRGRQAPRVATVLAGVATLVAVVGLLALVSPSVRDQVLLSTTRQDAPFVETYLVDPEAAATCNGDRPRFRALVGVRSHLDGPERVPYVLALTPVDGGRARSSEGEVATVPGRETVVEVVAPKPTASYDAVVTFPATGQRLVVHCPGAAS